MLTRYFRNFLKGYFLEFSPENPIFKLKEVSLSPPNTTKTKSQDLEKKHDSAMCDSASLLHISQEYDAGW
jgi:hypothetical protein